MIAKSPSASCLWRTFIFFNGDYALLFRSFGTVLLLPAIKKVTVHDVITYDKSVYGTGIVSVVQMVNDCHKECMDFLRLKRKYWSPTWYSVVTIRSHQYMKCAIIYLYKLVVQPNNFSFGVLKFQTLDQKVGPCSCGFCLPRSVS